jgi:hypothetical protein
MRPRLAPILTLMLLAAAGQTACRSAHYSIWETLGREKRDLLRANVEQVQQEQVAARESFESALDRLKALTGFSGGELEKQYDRLRADQERAQGRAVAVHERTASIERIAADLFAEWEKEIEEISSADLRRRSRERLAETRRRYASLQSALRRSSASMEPVLVRLNDQVLFLKHNLNAQAVAGLKGEVASVEKEVRELVAEVSRSVAEAERFIAQLR